MLDTEMYRNIISVTQQVALDLNPGSTALWFIFWIITFKLPENPATYEGGCTWLSTLSTLSGPSAMRWETWISSLMLSSTLLSLSCIRLLWVWSICTMSWRKKDRHISAKCRKKLQPIFLFFLPKLFLAPNVLIFEKYSCTLKTVDFGISSLNELVLKRQLLNSKNYCADVKNR